MGLAVGYLGYSDKGMLIDNYTMSGSTAGLEYNLGYDFEIATDLDLGLQVSYLSGYLTKVDVTNGTTTSVGSSTSTKNVNGSTTVIQSNNII